MEKQRHLRIFMVGVRLLSVKLILITGLLLQTGSAGADNLVSLPGHGQSTEWETGTVTTANIDLEAIQIPSRCNSKLVSSLNHLLESDRYRGLTEAEPFAMSDKMLIEDDRVQVTIVTTENGIDEVWDAVETVGGKYQLDYMNYLQALVPISQLEALAQHPEVLIIREPKRPVHQATEAPLYESGAQTTEGVTASNASAWHSASFDGSGVRVAVIDAGFTGYEGLLGTDLPAIVNTYDWTASGMDGSVHGSACAEIIFDMANGITMDLHKVSTDIEIANAVNQAIADGVDIISMSLGVPLGGPGDGTGFLAGVVSDARSNDIFYAVSAGNNAEHSWSGTFTDTDGDDYHEWAGSQEINYFGPGNGDAYVITEGSIISVYLHWDDWTNVDQDYDLLLIYTKDGGTNWQTASTSTNVQNGGNGQEPVEMIGVIAPATAIYGVVVNNYDSTRDVFFRLNASHQGPRFDETVPARSIMFPADSPDAISVGAVDVTPPYLLEPYSSQGPTFGQGGSSSGGLTKPDIAGYANASTVSYGPGMFAGTSAAAPHVAGAAALLKERYPGYNVSQLQDYLENNAIDLGEPGKDNQYGSGRLYLQDCDVDGDGYDGLDRDYDCDVDGADLAELTRETTEVRFESFATHFGRTDCLD